MKIPICDICYYEKPRVIKAAKFRMGHKNGKGLTFKYDVCEEHKEFTKGLSLEEAERKVMLHQGFTFPKLRG